MSNSLCPYGLYPTRLLCPWGSPGKNTGVGCHALFQRIFLTQGSNLCLLHPLHWQTGSLPLAPLGKTQNFSETSSLFSSENQGQCPILGLWGVVRARLLKGEALDSRNCLLLQPKKHISPLYNVNLYSTVPQLFKYILTWRFFYLTSSQLFPSTENIIGKFEVHIPADENNFDLHLLVGCCVHGGLDLHDGNL